MIKNTSYNSNSFLSKYIDRFYTFEYSNNTNVELAPILPGTGLELLFHLDKPLSVNNKTLPKAHIVCPRTIAYYDKQSKVNFLSVRFKSGAFRHFTSIPFSKLNNTFLSLQDLWEDQAEDFLNTFNTCYKIPDKIKVIEHFLTQFFNEYHKKNNDKWDVVIDELYYNFDTNTIEKLSQKTGLSLRQFERNFKAQFGITAKEFQKITRFQDVTKNILLNKKLDYLDIVLDNGYFDQSHFIKEFKFLTKKTPLEFFTKAVLDNHFYHKSIKNS